MCFQGCRLVRRLGLGVLAVVCCLAIGLLFLGPWRLIADPLRTLAIAKIELPQLKGGIGDLVFLGRSRTSRLPDSLLIAVAASEAHGTGIAYYLDPASGAVVATIRGSKIGTFFDDRTFPIPDCTGDGLPELVCESNERAITIVSSSSCVLATLRLNAPNAISDILEVLPEAPGDFDIYCSAYGNSPTLMMFKYVGGAMTLDWQLPLGAYSAHVPSESALRVVALRALVVKDTGKAEALIAFVQSKSTALDDFGVALERGMAISLVRLGSGGKPTEVVAVTGIPTARDVLVGDTLFLGEETTTSALVSTPESIYAVDATGRAKQFAMCPRKSEFIGPPLALGKRARDGAVIVAIAAARMVDEARSGVHASEDYLIGPLQAHAWQGAIRVGRAWSTYRSIAGCADIDKDGEFDVIVAQVQSEGDDFADGVMKGIMAAPTEVFVLSGKQFNGWK